MRQQAGGHVEHDQEGDQGQGEAEDQASQGAEPTGDLRQPAADNPLGASEGEDGVDHLVLGARGQQGLDLRPGPVRGEGSDGDGHGAVQGGENDQIATHWHSRTLDWRIPNVCDPKSLTGARQRRQVAGHCGGGGLDALAHGGLVGGSGRTQ